MQIVLAVLSRHEEADGVLAPFAKKADTLRAAAHVIAERRT